MTETLHIVRKDLFRLRWWLGAWVVLLFARVVVAIAGTGVATTGATEQFLFLQAAGLMAPIAIVMLAVLISRFVHDEPLVGLDWWWLVRPYDRHALLLAKLLLVAVFFVFLPVVAELVVMAAFDASPRDMLGASSAIVARDARSALALMVIAVMTPSLVAYALTLVGVGVGLALLLIAVAAVAFFTFDDTVAAAPTTAPDPTVALVATLVFVAASATVILYQYRHRRLARAIALTAAGLVAVGVVPAIWPWSFAPPLQAVAPPGELAGVTATVDATRPEIGDASMFGRRARARALRQVIVPLQVAGLPPAFRVDGVLASARFELPDGQVLESQRVSGGGRLEVRGAYWLRGTRGLQAAIGDVRLGAVEEPELVTSAALLTLTDDELARYGSQTGRLTASLDFVLRRSALVGTVPLADGASLGGDASRTSIVRVERHRDGCTVFVRQWRVTSLLARPRYPQYDFVLRNLKRREAVTGNRQEWQGARAVGFSPFLLTGFTLEAGNSGFDVHYFVLDFPLRLPGQLPSPTVDAAWMADADLAMVETMDAGSIRRSIAVDGFQMQRPAAR